MPRPWKRNKNQNLSVIFFFSLPSWCNSRKRIGTPATQLLWLHSIYFSSIFKGLWHFPSGSETVCPFSLLQHWDYRAVCASPHSRRGFNFSSALETDLGFSGKEKKKKKRKSVTLGASLKSSRWLLAREGWNSQFHFSFLILMPILSCPLSP